MDAFTLGYIGVCTAGFAVIICAAVLCQKWENYIKENIINKK